MAGKCCACSKEFVSGDSVVTFYLEKVLAGEKSGVLGFYDDDRYPDREVDHVHFSHNCLEKCFSPIENPFLYDTVVESIRKDIYEDEADSVDDIPINIDDDPPYCLWCKREDTVWKQIQRDLHIFNCIACSRLWDQDETELIWDPQNGYTPIE